MFNLEKLDVWHKAVRFAGQIYQASRSFPIDERFGLTDQVRRAAVSIASNIAEGSARPSADFARFLGCAGGSVAEVVTQGTIARNAGILTATKFDAIYADAEEISRMLSGLRKSLGE